MRTLIGWRAVSALSLVVAVATTTVTGLSTETPRVDASAGSFVPLTPARVLDTRAGAKVGSPDGAAGSLPVPLSGRAGLPGSGIGAVALNVTVVEAEGSGFVTVYPCGTRPDSSNLNFVDGQTIPNSVIAPVSPGGELCFYVYGVAHLLADVSGYFPTGSDFVPVEPARIGDTRSPGGSTVDGMNAGLGSIPANTTLAVPVAGRASVPGGVSAVALNVTVVNAQGAGYATVFPCGSPPDASNLNFVAGQTIPNSVVAPVSPDGEVCIFTDQTVDVLVDVSGYFAVGSDFQTLTPARVVDTRGVGKVGTTDGTGAPLEVSLFGQGGLPSSGIAAVALNVTVVDAEGAGFVTVYPCGAQPDASNLNFVDGQTIPNAVLAPVSTNGTVCFYAYGTVHLLADVSGYFPGSGTPTPGALRFDLKNSVGLALAEPGSSRSRQNRAGPGERQSSSNLFSVDSDGSLSPATSSGTATVERFLIGPNGKVYVLFAQPTNLNDTTSSDGSLCLLAEVDPDNDVPTCIDSTLQQISWQQDPVYRANPAIQFDSAGWIYYQGTTNDGRTVLRRYRDGSVTDLINDNISLLDFVVRPDSSIFMLGTTQSNQNTWVRRIAPGGGLRTIVQDDFSPFFLREFPDGNIYFGGSEPQSVGVRRFLTSSAQLDPRPWIAGSDTSPYFDAQDFCASDDPFCAMNGAKIVDTFTAGSSLFALAGDTSTVLMQYFPVLGRPVTQVRRVGAADGVGPNIVLAGTNSNSRNILTVLNTESSTEDVLIGPNNEIEIYRLNYVAEGDRVMFDGLRFSDNRYVIGQVDLSTGAVSVTPIDTGQLVDFATF